MARTSTSWKKGAPSPNPAGRPKGSREIYPKVRMLLAEMVLSEDPRIRKTISECLRSKDHVTKILGLYSKLNYEALMVVAVAVVVFTGWRERAVAFAVAAAGIIINWCHYVWIRGEHPMLLGIAHHALLFVFLGFAVIVILRNLFEGTAISGDAVLGGLCGYIIAAAMWANLYAIIEILLPGSFALSPALAQDLPTWQGRQALFNYFSLVTLTTMGYGDVVPVRPPATALAPLEAIFGQFYIAVVVAQLVGLRLAQASGPTAPPSR
jgi:hypothetical protein